MPTTLAQVTSGNVPVPAALGAAPVTSSRSSSGRPVQPVGRVKASNPARLSAPVRKVKPPPPPRISAPVAPASSRPRLRGDHQRRSFAAETVARHISASLATAGRVAGALFDDALDQRGLPTPLGPQPFALPHAATPSTSGSTAPVWAEGPTAPLESNESRVMDDEEPRLIISLDPGIEDDEEGFFREDGPMGPIVLPDGLSPLRDSDMEF